MELKKHQKVVFLVDIQFLTLKLKLLMDHTMMLTQMKWHLKLLVLWHSKNGMAKADPVLLEPIMKVEVTVPEEYMGDVMGDLNSRRGRIEGMEAQSGAQVIRAMFHYQKCLDILQHLDQELKVEEYTVWNLLHMNQFQRVFKNKL